MCTVFLEPRMGEGPEHPPGPGEPQFLALNMAQEENREAHNCVYRTDRKL